MSDTKENIKIDELKSWEEALENETWLNPLVNIFEREDEFVIDAFLPGVFKENLRIKFEEGYLVIMGRIDYESVMKHKYVLREMETGNYFRKFKIDGSIDEMKINAKLDNGILRITLPKNENSKEKIIDIK